LNCFLNDKQMIQSPSVGIGSVTAAVPLLLEKHEFDYGVNPLAGAKPSRKTVYTYQFFPYPSSPGIAKPEQIITPAGTHIPPPDVLAPQVATEKVYDGKGNLLAETDYGYDEYSTYPLLNITGIQHDDDNYPSTWTVRGNLTSVRKCIAIASNLCGSYAVTTYTYDITGQVLSMTDPLGNPPTHYYYTDSFAGGNQAFSTNAYLTKITDPAGYSEEFSYNYLTGELASSTDENTQQTTYNYESNAILRLTDVVGPASWQNGGAKPDTHYAYVDGPGGSVTITDPVGVKSASYSDGVGHVIETQLETDPNTADTVNTCYTGSGQVYQKTNPYRGTPTTACPITSSVPFTTYYYDALGRPIETVEQDGSTLWSCYNQTPAATPHPVAPAGVCSTQIGSVSTGSWVDSIDEKGNHWQRTSDSFGRLTEVMEPSGTSQAPSMETDYGYDFLNNLLSVNQCGALCTSPASNGPIVRSFQYDSLSRLLSATNPETGRVTYSYDANNNLKTKIDARGVTTSYQYDLLNRVLSKSFSGDVSKTPLSCYQYNASSAACSQANPNWIGRLTNAWTQSASTTSSCSTSASFLTKRSISCYDEMGRITNEQQYTLASQASGVNYLPQYIYDLDGNLTSSTDGVTPNPTTTGSMLTFVNSYDLGRHLQSVTSNWNDASHPPTVFSTNPGSTHPSYTAFGALQSGTFAGISNGITLGRAYDNRMRIMSETDTPSSNQSATPGSATVTILGMEQSH
jgi:YD repeat-containing protein